MQVVSRLGWRPTKRCAIPSCDCGLEVQFDGHLDVTLRAQRLLRQPICQDASLHATLAHGNEVAAMEAHARILLV